MENWKKEFIEKLKAERTTYADMIDFCCDALILNNEIISNGHFYFDVYCGNDYDEENEEYYEVYQYFIIGANDAERIAEYTNEIVYYNDELDIYLLGVCHWGTSWDYVPSNWKDFDED